jgi:hypothetical protein
MTHDERAAGEALIKYAPLYCRKLARRSRWSGILLMLAGLLFLLETL